MNEHEKNELILKQRQEIARLTRELAAAQGDKSITKLIKEKVSKEKGSK